ncbi:hypothetical protein, partial [Nocardia carnea]|uniref:hypothetical protein n=1 Tax=Nocardia carnea TaxID=37328 RepID=UPI003D78712D
MLFPVAGGFGFVSNRAADAVDNVSAELVEGTVPGGGAPGGGGRGPPGDVCGAGPGGIGPA